MPNLLASITSQTSGTAPATYADVPGLSAVVNVASTNSIILLIAAVPIALDKGGDHSSAKFQFADGGTREGPEQWMGYEDNTDSGLGGCIVYAKTGISGSHTFSLQWLDGGSDVAATLDTGRDRSFQVIELLDGEANLLVDIELTTSGSAPGTWADIPGFSATPSIAGTDSVLLMIAMMSTTKANDATADMRFAVDGTREGPELTWFYNDNAIEKAGGVLSHVKTGISGSHTLSVQWQDRSNAPDIDTANARTFQVIELLNADLLLDITSVTSGTAPGTYANIPALSGTPTVSAAASIVLMGMNVPIVLDATDRTADFQFADGGTREGPEVTLAFSDNSDEGGGGGMLWAKTGISGSRTFSAQWQDRLAAPSLDTGRTRSFWVIELKGVAEVPVTSDAVANYESLVGLTADEVSNYEALLGITTDRGPSAESQVGLTKDEGPNQESLVSLTKDAVSNYETLISVLKDAISPFEALQGVLKDAGVNVEAEGLQTSDRVTNYETLASVTQDQTANYESLISVLKDAIPNLEALFGVLKDAGANVEAGGTVTGDQTVNYESLISVLKDAVPNFESLVGVLKDAGINFESLVGLLKDVGINIEAQGTATNLQGINYETLISVLKDSVVNFEALQGIQQDAQAQFEALGVATELSGVNYESLSSVEKDAVANFESGVGILKDAGTNFESLVGIAATESTNFEALLGVINDAAVIYETLISLQADVTANLEALFGVLEDAGINLETGGTATQALAINLEALGTATQFGIVNISTFLVIAAKLCLDCPLADTLLLNCPLEDTLNLDYPLTESCD